MMVLFQQTFQTNMSYAHVCVYMYVHTHTHIYVSERHGQEHHSFIEAENVSFIEHMKYSLTLSPFQAGIESLQFESSFIQAEFSCLVPSQYCRMYYKPGICPKSCKDAF